MILALPLGMLKVELVVIRAELGGEVQLDLCMENGADELLFECVAGRADGADEDVDVLKGGGEVGLVVLAGRGIPQLRVFGTRVGAGEENNVGGLSPEFGSQECLLIYCLKWPVAQAIATTGLCLRMEEDMVNGWGFSIIRD